MASMSEFAQSMRQIALTVERGAGRVKRRCALAVDQAVVLGTPVRTGRARSNWLASIGAAATDVIATYGPDQASAAAIEDARGVVGRTPDGDAYSIHITNNVPYIDALNSGSSPQAPAGFVEAGVAAAVDTVRREDILSGEAG